MEAEIVSASFQEVVEGELPSIEKIDVDDLLDFTDVKLSLGKAARCAIRCLTEDGEIVYEEESPESKSSHVFDLRGLRAGRKYKLEITTHKGNVKLVKRVTHTLPDEKTLTKKTYKKKIKEVFYGKGRWTITFMEEKVLEWER